MTVTPYIDKLAAWLRDQGVRVYMPYDDAAPPMPFEAAGIYRSETREIWIGGGLSAFDALLTLAHEAGHWLGYHVRAYPGQRRREWQAYAYGWRLLRWLEAPVTRAEWRADCREADRLMYMPVFPHESSEES